MKDFELMLEEASDDVEREGIILCEACEINMERAELALETFEEMGEITARSNAIKAALVGGNFDDMVSFYEESASSADKVIEKKKSLIIKVWEAFREWWSKLWSTFRKAFGAKKVEDDAMVEVDSRWLTIKNDVAKFVATAKTFISTHKKEIIISMAAIVASILGVIGVKAIGKKASTVVIPASDAKKAALSYEKFNTVINDLTKEAEAANAASLVFPIGSDKEVELENRYFALMTTRNALLQDKGYSKLQMKMLEDLGISSVHIDDWAIFRELLKKAGKAVVDIATGLMKKAVDAKAVKAVVDKAKGAGSAIKAAAGKIVPTHEEAEDVPVEMSFNEQIMAILNM